MRTLKGLLAAVAVFSGCATKPASQTPTSPAPSPTPAPVKLSPLASVASGFGSFAKIFPKPKPKPPKAEAIKLIGSVRLVNAEEKFILIDAVLYQAVAGETLITLVDQRQTSTLRLSSLRNPPFLIADIVSGTPSVGEKVYKP